MTDGGPTRPEGAVGRPLRRFAEQIFQRRKRVTSLDTISVSLTLALNRAFSACPVGPNS
jgi:hypothetical protein